jgi:hypothetical protein
LHAVRASATGRLNGSGRAGIRPAGSKPLEFIFAHQLLGAPLSIQHTTLFFWSVLNAVPWGMVPSTILLRMELFEANTPL